MAKLQCCGKRARQLGGCVPSTAVLALFVATLTHATGFIHATNNNPPHSPSTVGHRSSNLAGVRSSNNEGDLNIRPAGDDENKSKESERLSPGSADRGGDGTTRSTSWTALSLSPRSKSIFSRTRAAGSVSSSLLEAQRSLLQNAIQRAPENVGDLSPFSSRQNETQSAATTEIQNASEKCIDTKTYLARKETKDWHDGEYGASWLSKLLFRYVSPLLQIAQDRRLEISDALIVPPNKQMECVVPKLSKKLYEEKSNAKIRRLKKLKGVGSAGPRKLGSFLTAHLLQKKKRYVREEGEGSDAVILAKALLNYRRSLLMLTGALRLLNTTIQAFPALLVARLLRLVEANAPPSQSIRAAAALVAVLSIKMVVENQYFHNVVKYATQVRGALTGIIFDKALRVSSSEVPQALSSEKDMSSKQKIYKSVPSLGAGGVLNLMQSDASILESAAVQLHTIWDGPLQIIVYTYLLYQYLGSAVLWGISVLMLTIPVNIFTLRLLNRMTKFENQAKDARTRRTTEVISNMKLLKLQAWENKFAEDIERERTEELRRHVSRGTVRAVNQAISNAVPAVVLVVTLMAYTKSGKPIVASTIFTAISLFNQLRFPLLFYPMLIDSLANGKNALKRVASYLSSEEITPYVQRLPALAGHGGRIEMRNGNFLWSSKGKPALCDANLCVEAGEVVAVVGNVGSGKSALVKALLGELSPAPRIAVDKYANNTYMESFGSARSMYPDDLDAPNVITFGPTVYCSQESWLSKGSIRDAVVFGREYNETRYRSALRDAGLDDDVSESEDEDIVSSKAAASQGVLSDSTDVGEGGSSLSGGQRARVALARALYDDFPGVYLLDDPLAALDASVGTTVFGRLTARLRAAGSATILVTNDPALPRLCDRVVLMRSDKSPAQSCPKILDVGTYEELRERGRNLQNIAVEKLEAKKRLTAEIEFEAEHEVKKLPSAIVIDGRIEYLNSTEAANTCHADPDCQINLGHDPDCFLDKIIPEVKDVDDTQSIWNAVESAVTPVGYSGIPGEEKNIDELLSSRRASDKFFPSQRTEQKLLSADDAMTTGAIPRSTYLAYLKAVQNPTLIVATILSYLLVNGAQFFQQYVVSRWTELGRGDTAMATALGGKYLRSLANAAFVVSTFLWIRSYLLMKVGVRASRRLHDRMLRSVVAAPVSFFDSTPSGQLISRFGKELDTVDRSLPDSIGSVMFCFLQIFASCAALAGVVTPAMLFPMTLIGAFYVKTMGRFRPAARDLKRCESKSRAPIYTHFREALRGTETIRSLAIGPSTWSAQHRKHTDLNLSVFYSVKSLDRWLSIRLETLGNAVVFTAAIASIALSSSGRMKPGSAGWGLTQSLAITGLLTWAVRCLTDLESQMMSVLRVQEVTGLEPDSVKNTNTDLNYNDTTARAIMPRENSNAGSALLVEETSKGLSGLKPAPFQDLALSMSGWPWQGGVHFKNIFMRYNPAASLVLKNVTIDVRPGSTLGIVGRSGSGKSSLLLALFRLVEIEKGSCIEIDGVDIRSVSLNTLRQSLSIIPQDPVLFAGTVMYNLDATGKASKSNAWDALRTAAPEFAAQLARSDGLNTILTEGGKNFSVGQRQLICLARALLRRTKILVMDEATSSVDIETDSQVQDTIRKEFVDKGVSVITVAHRLQTVIDYDCIAVLGDGKLLEYGEPNLLLRKRGGMLRQMVEDDLQKQRKDSKLTPVAAVRKVINN